MTKGLRTAAFAALLLAPAAVAIHSAAAQEAEPPLGFFVTSSMHSGNLGGLAGADAICQDLAANVGAGNRTWRAYLSTIGGGNTPPVNARDRIGDGPWYNANGTLIAANVADLHGDYDRDRNNINVMTAITENGDTIPSRLLPDSGPQEHDILTGSDSHGRAFPAGITVAGYDLTCENWTSESDEDFAMIGHHDRISQYTTSWNSSHATQGCSLEALRTTGGTGRFYCFAAD